MSTAAQAKAAGLKLGADRKKIAALSVLVLAAIILFWYNSRPDENGHPTATVSPVRSVGGETAAVPTPVRIPSRTVHRVPRTSANDRGTLRVRAIDATHGDVDPTLRLDLLRRLQLVEMSGGARSLFEIGPAPVAASVKPVESPVIIPKPVQSVEQTAIASAAAMTPIPLKFYGFVRPIGPKSVSRGFFLDGDNILVAAEGETLKSRYRVAQLAAGSALVEDIEKKNTQTLPLVPEARNDQ